jgi:hypothetical protein
LKTVPDVPMKSMQARWNMKIVAPLHFVTALRGGTSTPRIFCKAFTNVLLCHGAKRAAILRIRPASRFKTIKAAMPVPQKTIGIPWFGPGDYGACRAVMADGASLPDQYGDWLKEAERLSADAQAAGHYVLKVHIAPKDFSNWCRARNIVPDAKARVRFANFIAFREAGYISGNPGRVPRGSLARLK